ncbi:Palmitoyltransferase [Oopsacas minuta]|uniref:Palmitoyltransferase n=1 Tax=Oopsacas minuta TaxID=111878 RepID=A0AAV7JVI7_9METZ|nr:Palmitoyltransferase [Oopsacas minuta]
MVRRAFILIPAFCIHLCVILYSLYIEYKFLYLCQLFGSLSNTLFYIHWFCAISALCLHSFLLFLDPGYTEKNTATEKDVPDHLVHKERIRFCDKCNSLKTPRIHHCSTCARCVWRMDHHCVWLARCVGHRNQKYFIHLLFYQLCCAYMDIVVVSGAVLFGGTVPECQERLPFDGYGTRIFNVCFSYAMCIGFIAFLSNLFLIQLYCAAYDTTYVEIMKGRKSSNKSTTMDNLRMVCGPLPLLWVIPCTAPQQVESVRPAELFSA